MKNILLVFFFCIGSWAMAQQESNPFSTAERNSSSGQSIKSTEVETANGPGGPDGGVNSDEKLPIDDYLPLLVLTAVGIIMYKTHKKRNLLS